MQQAQLQFIIFPRVERPASIYGSYGKTVKGVFKSGLVHVLRETFFDKYVEHIRSGTPVKKSIWFFKKEEDIADINDYLCECLPDCSADPETCPWVVNFSSVGPATALSIRNREGEISLYLTTAVMLMGINLQNIQIIGMVRPFGSIHSIVQASGRGGRNTGEKERQKVVCFLLFNKSDIGENIDVSQSVRNLCLTENCLKRTMMEYFGTEGCSGDSWCCSNCDLIAG